MKETQGNMLKEKEPLYPSSSSLCCAEKFQLQNSGHQTQNQELVLFSLFSIGEWLEHRLITFHPKGVYEI
jgi:hypothetical protein